MHRTLPEDSALRVVCGKLDLRFFPVAANPFSLSNRTVRTISDLLSQLFLVVIYADGACFDVLADGEITSLQNPSIGIVSLLSANLDVAVPIQGLFLFGAIFIERGSHRQAILSFDHFSVYKPES